MCNKDNVGHLPIFNDVLKTNENITNLMNHEYIERTFLFNRRLMQRFLNIFVIGNFLLSNMLLSQ
jgi:hypothetical protein